MVLVCPICVVQMGLQGSEIISLMAQTQEELCNHLEGVHHMPVIREGENREQTLRRFLNCHPEAKLCPDYMAARAPWTEFDAKT